MTAGGRRLSWILAAAAVLCAALAVGATLLERNEVIGPGQTEGEKIAMIKAERARLQARADAEARIALLPAFRIATLLTDALAVWNVTPISSASPPARTSALSTGCRQPVARPSAISMR